jgi:Glycosyl hydrolase family 53
MGGPQRILVGLAGSIALAAIPPAAIANVPAGFVGMNANGPLFSAAAQPQRELHRMVASGVESIRVVFNWSAAQPYPNWNVVPLDQVGSFQPYPVPTSFAETDQIVELAARLHLTVLPVVMYAPYWDQLPHPETTIGVPRSPAPYANYLRLLVLRYGPHGSFWRQHRGLPKVPIHMWQIWNEPNILYYWPAAIVPNYVNLLRAAHAAIKQADPTAKVVLAGMPEYVWTQLANLYKAGARGLFDVVAVHPYTKLPRGVITILKLVRRVMDNAGDRRKPIILTELNWPSALHRTPFGADYETTPAGQARKLAAVLPLLARNRRRVGLIGFYYYTWITDAIPGGDPFSFAGLLDFSHGRIVEKPAYFAFRRTALAIEGCSRKAGVATSCVRAP